MLKQVSRWLPLAVLAAPLFAGGFWLQFGDVSSNSDARALKAAFIVKPAGCHNPALAKVNASASGIVDGKLTSIPLRLIPLSQPGSYAVARTWPAKGKWVIVISATDQGRETGAIAKLGTNGITKEETQFLSHVPTRAEVESSLRAL